MDALLDSMSKLILDSAYLGPLIAFLAGLITSFTPCSLASVPLILSYVGGLGTQNTKRAFALSLTFAIGSAIVFTIFGLLASLLGTLIGQTASWWFIILGVLMMLMTLQMLGLYNFIPSNFLKVRNRKKGFFGAFIAGVLAGVFSSQCSTPVLIALLAIVAGKGSLVYGLVLLLMYGIGHGVLAVLAGTYVGFVQKISQSNKYSKISLFFKYILSLLMMLIGFYMFYLAFNF